MALLTARDAARLIAGPEGEGVAFERVRHFTRERLIVPAGELNPGHGRKRHYSPATVEKARTLSRLTDFGMTIQRLRRAADVIDGGNEKERAALCGLMNAIEAFDVATRN